MDDKRLFLFSLASWFVLMVLAILNAGLREGFYTAHLDTLQAHQLSTFTLIAIILIYTYLLLRFSGFQMTERQAFVMGCIWLVATVLFEFVAGHYVFGNSWEALVADYDILAGRIWVLIPLTTLAAPYVMRRIVRPNQ